jgi:hypothetical protein
MQAIDKPSSAPIILSPSAALGWLQHSVKIFLGGNPRAISIRTTRNEIGDLPKILLNTNLK